MPPLEPPDLAVPIKPREFLRRHPGIAGYSVAQPLLPKETVAMPDHPQNQPPQQTVAPQQPQQGQQAGQQPPPGQPQPQGQQPQGGQPPQQSPPPAGGTPGDATLDIEHHADAVAAAIRQQAQAGPPPAGAGVDGGRLQQILGQIGTYGPFVLQFLEALVQKLQGGQQPTP